MHIDLDYEVLKAELPWSLLGIAWLPDGAALQAREGRSSHAAHDHR